MTSDQNNKIIKRSIEEFLIIIALFIISIVLFSVIADEIVIENQHQLDDRVFRFIASYTTPAVTSFALFITNFGSGFFLIPAYLIMICLLTKRNQKHLAIISAVVATISILSGWLLKNIFHRQRPLDPLISNISGYSFPSGHTLAAFTFSGVMIYLISRSHFLIYTKWIFSIACILLACLVGLSRIYLRAHFASDVLGSFCVTIAWLSLTFAILPNFEDRMKS